MLVLAMEFSRGIWPRTPEQANSGPGAASGRQLDRERRRRRETSGPVDPVPLPQNGTEVPARPDSAPRETDGLRPWRCPDDRVASDRPRSTWTTKWPRQ